MTESPRNFRAVNPATGTPLDPEFSLASPAEIDAAAQAAGAAVDALQDPEARAAFLDGVATELDASADSIVARAQLETALPEARLRGELGRTTAQLRLFAQVAREGSWVDARIDTADPERTPIPKPDVRSMLVPLGPVIVFGASNFPLAFSVAGGDTASAWAAGNPVIVKAHPAHPGTSQIVGECIERARASCRLPSGVFALLFDDGHRVGTQLVQHPAVKAVGFTGSRAGGLAIARAASDRPTPIPVFAEMGSVNPVVILPDAIRRSADAIADGLFGSCTLGVGQFCTNPGLVFVPAGKDGDSFVTHLGERFKKADLPPMLTEAIAANYLRRSSRLTELGARLVSEAAAGATNARLYEVDAHVITTRPELAEEVFGPATLLVRYDDPADLDAAIDVLGGQLTATLHAGESDEVEPVWRSLTRCAGRVLFGGYPTGVEVNHAMVHGGPYPATTDPSTTSVGTRAVRRFARLVAFQNAPQSLLPQELRDENPRGVWRLVNGTHQNGST